MYTLVESKEDLEFLNSELNECEVICIDTEFRRTTKDNITLALLQINDSKQIYLIDCAFSRSKITTSLCIGFLKKNLHLKHMAKKARIFLVIL